MASEAWTSHREHGTKPLVRLIIWLTLRCGRAVGQLLLYPITAYFFLGLPPARAASRAYLARALGRPVRTGDVWRHFFTFACVILDRICLLAGRAETFRIEVTGVEALTRAVAAGRGCLLLGSHLGSFEVLRAYRRHSPAPVRALMYRGTTGPLSTFIEALDPALGREVIEIGAPDSMLRVRESLGRGEIVGILADRSPEGQRSLPCGFLGAPAAFPTGPARLAAALEVPVVLFFGIRRGPRDYEISFEAFADRLDREADGRVRALAYWVDRYAARLEARCRAYPFNWFNFFDFWRQGTEPGPTLARPRRAPGPIGPAARRGAALATGADR